MNEEKTTYDVQTILFTQLVLSFQASAWQQMGKVMNIFTHKIERDLTQAQMSIDMLAMLQDKTEGNLSEEEARLLDKALFELRMNYIDEVEKEKKNTEQGSSRESGEEETKQGEEQDARDARTEEHAVSDENSEVKQTSDTAGKEKADQPDRKKRRPATSAKKGQDST